MRVIDAASSSEEREKEKKVQRAHVVLSIGGFNHCETHSTQQSSVIADPALARDVTQEARTWLPELHLQFT